VTLIERKVTHSRKDRNGKVIALGNPAEYWSPRPNNAIIQDIQNEIFSYYIQDPDGNRSFIQVVEGPLGKILQIASNGSAESDLEHLPNC
jgi:hypothetical protein